MPSRICRSCGAKKANRPGTMCYTCWVAAGKPTAEEAAAKAARDAELAETAVWDQAVAGTSAGKPPGLSEEVQDDLAAMEHVNTRAPSSDRTYQHASMRAMKERSPVQFFALFQKLKEARGVEGPVAPEKWDGDGPCPTCGFEKEKPLDDPGTSKILALLAELDERELATTGGGP